MTPDEHEAWMSSPHCVAPVVAEPVAQTLDLFGGDQ